HLSLVEPRILIGEFIPFGQNGISAFVSKLDAYKRVRSSMITAFHDDMPAGTQFRTGAQQTAIEVVDFHPSRFIKVNAQVFYPEQAGITQTERFGVYINSSGKIIIGLKVDSVLGIQGSFPVDAITRVFSDTIFDSSELLDTILNNHQRGILNLVFFNKAMTRDKFISVITKRIDPIMPIEDLMDGEANENELKQIIEYVDKFKEWDDGTRIFVGTHGLILNTDDHAHYEVIIANYSYLKSIDVFLANFFSRVWSLQDDIKEIHRKTIEDFDKDPRSVGIAQTELSGLSQNCTLLEETRIHIRESLIQNLREFLALTTSLTEKQKRLVEFLGIEEYTKDILARISDAKKVVAGLNNDVQGLRDQVNVVNEKRLQNIFRQLKDSTAVQMRQAKASERQDSKMNVLNLIIAGSLVFNIIALVVGGFSFSDPGNMVYPSFFGLSFTDPVLWTLFFIGIWLLFSLVMTLIMRYLSSDADANLSLKLEYGVPIDLEALQKLLTGYDVAPGEIEHTEGRTLHHIDFKMTISDSQASVSMTYDMDPSSSFLHSMVLDIEKPRKGVDYLAEIDKLFIQSGIIIRKERVPLKKVSGKKS
ncbi:MAG: hypothetical protein JW839_22735, partial [Candidatus Lokiarchaeota archaeon]|nr:hypothetical protein [Candidatus Lokiarchaeota archaeon]